MYYNSFKTFNKLFNEQLGNQQKLMDKGAYNGFTDKDDGIILPVDDPHLCSYHVQQLVSEIGEVLEADKRWKNFRNEKNDSENKLEEIADCVIVCMNLAIFSGFDAIDLENAITRKLGIVSERIDNS
jgi:NTP pyrophosphatase (non-canonical NTP hydrolase)